jgi:hypothetical protein
MKPGTLLSGLLLTSAAWSQPGVTLEVQPATVTVSPWYRQIETRVVLTNGSSAPLSNLTLSFFTNDRFEVEAASEVPGAVAAGHSVVWPVRVKNVDGSRLPGTVQFEAAYVAAAGGKSYKLAMLHIAAAAEAGPAKPVEVALGGAFDSISENRPGTGYLLVTNSLDVPVDISGVAIRRPGGIKELPKIEPFTVAAHSAVEKEIKLEAESRLTPGKYPLLIDVRAEWDRGGHRHSRNLVVSRDVNLGIFFESELLKLLGIPSFLLLPGCLFVFSMQLLVTLGILGVKNESRLPKLTPATTGFWIVAITFSGVFAYGYYKVTGTNYLVMYGVNDLRNVWLSSIALGCVTYLAVGKATEKSRASRVPTAQDDPIAILRKMSKHGVGILASPVSFDLNKVSLRGFLAERVEDEQTLVWVVPKIATHWEQSKDALNAQEQFEELVNTRANPARIADSLDEWKQKNLVAVSWLAANAVPNPYHLKLDAITGYLPAEVMIEVQ